MKLIQQGPSRNAVMVQESVDSEAEMGNQSESQVGSPFRPKILSLFYRSVSWFYFSMYSSIQNHAARVCELVSQSKVKQTSI